MTPTDLPPVKLECRSVWKIFGERAAQIVAAAGGVPDEVALTRAGLVAAVCDVNLEVREGENFVIMGLSGSGKSTLVRCMSRLVEPSAGEILFNGENLLESSEARMIEVRRHQMGMVFQHFALLPHLTVLGNVAFPLEIQGVDRRWREERAREIISLVGLEGREGFFPREAAGHFFRIGRGDSHDLVDKAGLPQRRRVTDTDSFDLVRAGFAAEQHG